MALFPAPISIPEALTDLLALSTAVRRKNRTLVDYYIYPEPVPSKISDFEPRILLLETRIRTLAKLSFPALTYIFDDSDAYAAAVVLEISAQIVNAAKGFSALFERHYDRHLEDRKPYDSILATLRHREEQLDDIKRLPKRGRVEDLRAQEPMSFCRGALAMMNGRDTGRLKHVESGDLVGIERARLKAFGGAYLWWQCAECVFTLKYHIASSKESGIDTTEEVREHQGGKVEYRSRFLAKCHLFLPAHARNRGRVAMKYGCVFCYGYGKEMRKEETAFADERDLAEHMEHKHRKNLPPVLMLEKFLVAVKEKLPLATLRRWDVNFR